MAFASVFCKARPVVGSVSDLEGLFSLQPLYPGDTVVFSFVGYEPQQYVYGVSASIRIYLKEQATDLTEVVVRPTENPAWRIIERAIRNKDRNNPDNIPSFSYRSYNKAIARLRNDSLVVRDTSGESGAATGSVLFLNETYTERVYFKPGKSRETILANRMAGFREPFAGLVSGDFQPFSYYGNEILFLNKSYTNPISKGSRSRYDFVLQDTLLNRTDTVFVITFKPFDKKNFSALKGRVGIHATDFAIQFIQVEPADEALLVAFKLQQINEPTQGRWFPSQSTSELIFKQYRIGGKPVEFIAKSHFSNVRFENLQKPDLRDGVTVQSAPTASRQKEDFWAAHRSDSLTAGEMKAYEVLDSLGRKIKLLDQVPKLVTGRVRMGMADVLLKRIYDYNLHEGHRLGLGLETNERLSSFFRAGGYFAYGTRDRVFKYGGWLRANLMQRHDVKLTVAYRKDVLEPGTVEHFQQNQSGRFLNLRSALTSRMDFIEQISGEVSARPFTYGQVSVMLASATRMPIYEYAYANRDNTTDSVLRTTEIGLGFRYAHKEGFRQIGNAKMVVQPSFPVFTFYYGQGMDGFWRGEYAYGRVFVKMEHSFASRYIGRTDFQVSLGRIVGNAPYPLLNIGQGSYAERLNLLDVANTFRTMRLYEFVADRYAYLFLRHNFGRLLFNPRSEYSKPEINVVQSIGWGDLANPQRHENLAFQTLRRGYFESGLLINDLLRVEYLKLYYIGIGCGVFYRYGPYAFAERRDNLVYKISITASF